MASEIRVNQIQNRSGLTTTTFTDNGVTISGILTVSENLNVGGVLTYEDVTNVDAIGIVTARAGINLVGNDLNVGSNIKIGNASGIVTATTFSGSGANLTSIPAGQLTGTLPAISGANLTGITGTTINNNANNRVITGSGTANTLEGEANLVWDGSAMGVGLNNPNDTLHVYHATDNLVARFESGDTGGGITLKDNTHVTSLLTTNGAFEINVDQGGDITGETIAFKLSGSEKLRITSTGLLLGGTDAQNNTTLGGNAGDSFTGTDAQKNTLIGKDAGTAITSGDEHTALGYNALKTLTTNASCTAIGAYALEDCTGAGNVAVGYNALKELSSGQNNVAMGFDAATNAIGNLNVAIGRDAMKAGNHASNHDSVVIGAYAAYQSPYQYQNVIIGRSACSENTQSNPIQNSVFIGYEAGKILGGHCASNVAIGPNAMGGASSSIANRTGLSDNVAIGQKALENAKTSTNNSICIGQESGQNAATGSGTYSYWSHNIAIGYRAQREATGGADNVLAIGSWCLENHTGDGDGSSGGYTVAYGNGAFRANRHIRHSVAVGNDAGNAWNPAKGNLHEGGSTFVGGGAGRTVTTGTALIGLGRDALSGGGPCTGHHNTAIGSRCFEKISSGSHNCAVGGLYTGLQLTTGDYNNFFGSLAGYAYNVNTSATGDHNNVFGGYSAASAAGNDHENIFGGGLTGKGANTTYIRGSVYNSPNSSSFSTTSDERIKKNIVDNNTGLDAIEKIRVRNFEYRTQNEITDFDNAGAVVVDKEGVQLGVIAQEIKDILPDLVKQNTTGAYAVDPDNLTWYLVNAVKELSAEVKSLKAQINS